MGTILVPRARGTPCLKQNKIGGRIAYGADNLVLAYGADNLVLALKEPTTNTNRQRSTSPTTRSIPAQSSGHLVPSWDPLGAILGNLGAKVGSGGVVPYCLQTIGPTSDLWLQT